MSGTAGGGLDADKVREPDERARTKLLGGLLWLVPVLLSAWQAFSALRRPLYDRLADLHVYYGSIKSLTAGASIYAFHAANGDPFTYPPFAAIVLAPLVVLSEPAARVTWTVAAFALLPIVPVLVARHAGRHLSAAGPWLAPTVAALLAASAPFSSNIRFGQVSWFLCALVLLDTVILLPPRYRGIATGLASAIKLTPLIFLLHYWFSGQRRAAVTGVLTFLCCTGLTWVVLPHDSGRYWFTELAQTNRIGDLGQDGNQSIAGMLYRLHLAGPIRLPLLACMVLIVLVQALRRAAVAVSAEQYLIACAVIGSAGIAISPVSWTHHQFWLLLAAVAAFHTRGVTALWRIWMLSMMLLPVTALSSLPWGFGLLADNARGIMAILIAAALPFVATSTRIATGEYVATSGHASIHPGNGR